MLPIVGNAAEHAGAVLFAMKGKLDLSLGVAIGSSTQIALLVMPLLVLLGWMMGQPMNLDFGGYESVLWRLRVSHSLPVGCVRYVCHQGWHL